MGDTKTRRHRVVPIGPTLHAALEGYHVQQMAICQRLGIVVEQDDCVFAADAADARKVPKSPGLMAERFSKARDRAGLKSVSPHYLRHTAITHMLAGTATAPGISVADAAAIAGHSNPAITARVYAHAVAANQQRGIALADAMLDLGPETEQEQNVVALHK